MSYYTTKVAVPQSFVTSGKQRLKQHTDTVYLNNGDEFEIELYNPTTNKVLAKIELNGQSIGSGIVLRPGERVFLERHLDEAKKFLFETYKVDGGNNEVQQAIMKNGLVTVSFFNEEIRHTPIRLNSGTWYNSGTTTIYPNTPFTYTTINTGNPTFTTSGLSGTFTTSGTYLSNTSVTTDCLLNTSSTLGNKPRIKKSKSIETGRVEKGSSSNQSFTTDSTSFSSYASTTNTWKILPKSQKLVTKEDLTVYCTECGSKRKKDSFKFCPQCGTKF